MKPNGTVLQKPYSQIGLTREKCIYNYRLSRARRIVENAFGILTDRFRVFMTPIGLTPEKAEKIVLASCTLHNFLRSRSEASTMYTPPGSIDTEDPITHQWIPDEWRKDQAQGLQSFGRQYGN